MSVHTTYLLMLYTYGNNLLENTWKMFYHWSWEWSGKVMCFFLPLNA